MNHANLKKRLGFSIFRVKMVLGSKGDPFYAYVTFISIKQCNETY